MTNWLNGLPTWNNDPADQILWIQQLKTMLQAQTDKILEKQHDVILLSQTTEPSQVQWETAYTAQTGKSLPIPPYASLVWWDSNNNIIGGYFGTVFGSTTIYRREHKYPRKGTIYYGQSYLGNTVTTTAAINTSNTNHPSLSFSLPISCDLHLRYVLSVRITAGSGQYGGDFLFNGEKIGSTLLGVAPSLGITNYGADHNYIVEAFIPAANVQAGNNVIQAIFGVTGLPASPPTLQYGGTTGAASNWGIRVLTVKGVAP